MPFIHTITNRTVTPEAEQQLKKRFGQAIECVPGKSERYLMLALNDGCRMAFHGDNTGSYAMLKVDLFGQASDASLNTLTKALTDVVEEVLHIPSDGIYVCYTSTNQWGYDGENF